MELRQNLLVIRGPIAAGKSSLVNELRRAINKSSVVDTDAIKRLVDASQSSDWRREIAFDVSRYMMRRIMQTGRTIIADLHGSDTEQLDAYTHLAEECNYKSTSVLLYPPLGTCQERATNRFVPDISYTIDHDMVIKYWNETRFIPNETVYDTSVLDTFTVAGLVMDQLRAS